MKFLLYTKELCLLLLIFFTSCTSIQEKKVANERALFKEVSKYRSNYKEIVELLKSGANPNCRNIYSQTPIMIHLKNDPNMAVLRLLVRYGADLNAKDFLGNSILHYAVNRSSSHEVGNHNVKLVSFLVGRGANIHVRNNNGRYLIDLVPSGYFWYRKEGSFLRTRSQNSMYLYLEKIGAKNWDHILEWKARYGNYHGVLQAFAHGAKIKYSVNKDDPVIFASKQNNIELVKLLLKNGADPKIRSSRGESAIILATVNNHSKIIFLLKQYLKR